MKKTLSYLTDLENNNSREWYHAHKQRYKEANEEFEQLIGELIIKIGQTDESIVHLSPKDLTFKLIRDTRYSHDKSPYNPVFRAHISARGKLPIPVGYYLSIKPKDRSFIGGGLFTPMFRDATSLVRDHLVQCTREFQQIITDKSFANGFEVKGEALKNVPRGYNPNHPLAEFLKYKSWYLEYPVSDKLLLDRERLLAEMTEKFVCMQPFNHFLNNALHEFTMPTR